jgi:hypothetical protein
VRDGPETTVAYASRVYSVRNVAAPVHKTEYTRDAYATVLGDVLALVDKASPNFFIFEIFAPKTIPTRFQRWPAYLMDPWASASLQPRL